MTADEELRLAHRSGGGEMVLRIALFWLPLAGMLVLENGFASQLTAQARMAIIR
ncbi:MAG: hypothetical protein HY647_07865, partial [Acidobacteria bacterium]|nr:hypothetical protein [Acidobacteriota bacterium]